MKKKKTIPKVLNLHNNCISKLYLFFFILMLIPSCTKDDSKLKISLVQSKNNRGELEKALDYFKQSPADSLKYLAATFLIENMLGHYSCDSSYLHKYRPVIKKISALRNENRSINYMQKHINPLMDSLTIRYPLQNMYSSVDYDLTSIKADYLINNIELAFDSYDKNQFKDSIPFTDFLEYILPYRIIDRTCLEQWRIYFKDNFTINSQNIGSVHEMCDSLLYNFQDVKIGWSVASKYPYLKLEDYLNSLVTHCREKCWFNCMFLRSFGIPVAIDYVPACRVHDIGHEWNVLKLGDNIYPFEPFWLDSMRYLKEIYCKEIEHPTIGPIQFPKVYRITYNRNITELLSHAMESGEEIPSFFSNPFQKDVTSEYFETFDIESQIFHKIKGPRYAYACVMGRNQWVPVEFGKIKRGKILFSSLGSENVYLPCYFNSGSFIPANYPILLKDGQSFILRPDTSSVRNIEISYVAFERPELEKYKKALNGLIVEASNNVEFTDKKILYQITEPCEPGDYHIPLSSPKKYRFVRVVVPNAQTVLNEIKFFTKRDDKMEEIEGEFMSSHPNENSYLEKMVDNKLLTGVNFKNLKKSQNCQNISWVGYDFKQPKAIDEFEFYFVFSANVRKEGVYELFYWDFGWKSLGVKKSDSTKITFENVPENALLWIKIHDTGAQSRIFTYSEGEQSWW